MVFGIDASKAAVAHHPQRAKSEAHGTSTSLDGRLDFIWARLPQHEPPLERRTTTPERQLAASCLSAPGDKFVQQHHSNPPRATGRPTDVTDLVSARVGHLHHALPNSESPNVGFAVNFDGNRSRQFHAQFVSHGAPVVWLRQQTVTQNNRDGTMDVKEPTALIRHLLSSAHND